MLSRRTWGRARAEADTWQALGFAGRRARLDRWRTEIGSRASELAKPSEHSPGVGRWLVDAFAAAVPDCPDALCLVAGLGDTGAALCGAGVDKRAFTGSPATARKRQRLALPVAIPSFRRTERTDRLLARIIRLRHGRRR